jgi:Flp pilus assembly pilin Flp
MAEAIRGRSKGGILRALSRGDRGNASIEYALLGAIVGLGMISGLRTLKNGLNTNYDRITLAIQRVNNDTSGTRKETSRDSNFTYYSNGQRIDQVWIRYDDGSSALLRTSPDPNSWFQQIYYDFGKDGINHGAYVTRSNGSTYSETYETVRDGVVNINYTEGSVTHNYLQEQINLGNGYYGYRQTMNSTNIAGDWASGYVVNYYGNDANGQYVENNVGSRYTYANGQTVNYGQDISQYMR